MAKADRTPKKIAGLKLPKSIREAPAIRSLLATAAGRKILGDALIEGAATAAARVMAAHEAAKAAKSASTRAMPDDEASKAETPAAPKTNGAQKRAKPSKAAPGAAPADDLTPAAPQALMPVGDEPDPDLDHPAKPGAAD